MAIVGGAQFYPVIKKRQEVSTNTEGKGLKVPGIIRMPSKLVIFRQSVLNAIDYPRPLGDPFVTDRLSDTYRTSPITLGCALRKHLGVKYISVILV